MAFKQYLINFIEKRRIINGNLELMTNKEEGGMFELLCNESFGGNAGRWNGCSCAAANFYFNPKSGEIKYFGNYQDVQEDIRKNFQPGTFRVALIKNNGHYLFEVINRTKNTFQNPTINEIFEKTIKIYNKKQKNKI